MTKIALVTGATSGIGLATAQILLKNGFRVIVCGRRSERLTQEFEEFGNAVLPLIFDVRDKEKVALELGSLPDDWKDISILINNAGNAHGLAPIESGSLDDWDAMIDINVKGLLYVSKAIIPGMVERKSGHIINVGSIAGKEVYPNGNVYCASKHAVDAINNGMRIDLNQYGIKVSAINPGLVETGFSKVRFKGDDERAASVYKGFSPLKAEDIAEIILFTVTRPGHVNVSDLTVLPTSQANASIVKKDLGY
ncbi:MAG: SDR family NAD(P)-dependent oxidoreductase [Bacteroidota bacterium]